LTDCHLEVAGYLHVLEVAGHLHAPSPQIDVIPERCAEESKAAAAATAMFATASPLACRDLVLRVQRKLPRLSSLDLPQPHDDR